MSEIQLVLESTLRCLGSLSVRVVYPPGEAQGTPPIAHHEVVCRAALETRSMTCPTREDEDVVGTWPGLTNVSNPWSYRQKGRWDGRLR